MNDLIILGRNVLSGDIILGSDLIMSYDDFILSVTAGGGVEILNSWAAFATGGGQEESWLNMQTGGSGEVSWLSLET